MWTCHSKCGRGGSVYDFEMEVSGKDFAGSLTAVRYIIGRQPASTLSKRHIVAEYPYVDETGKLLFQAVRFDPKDFSQRRPDGVGGWTWNLSGIRRVLFRLDKLLAADVVLVLEGERDVLAAEKLGFTATCNPMGAGKWSDEYSPALAGKDIVIFPDNDDPGRAHAQATAASVQKVARSVKIVTVPMGKDISDWIVAGATKEIIEAAIADSAIYNPSVQSAESPSVGECFTEAQGRISPWPQPGPAGELPRICVNGRQLRDISDEALTALQAANDPPMLFARSGMMVAVIADEKQHQVIAAVGADALRGRLARTADYYRATKAKNGERGEYDCPPPMEVVKDILALPPAHWGFQSLDGVVEAPVLRPDGSILDNAGYDPETRLYYAPDPDLQVTEIAEHPSCDHIKAAVDLINLAIGDFPFVDHASQANAIAAMLTPIVKPAINSPTPMALLDAPQAGTGKSLIGDLISIIATGRPGEMFSAPCDEDEWRKQITMALMSGTAVVIIDNVKRPLVSPELCKALTETTHADRAFRTHDKIALSVKATFICTGNNIRLGGDMVRRCYHVRLDAKCSKPFLRTGPAPGRDFKIQDLKAWAIEHHGELLAALLTLARAWYVAGQKKPKLKPMGSYEAWSTTVGGILEFAGLTGFMENAAELYDTADSESVQWEEFLQVLHEIFYGHAFTVAEIAEILNEKSWNEDRRASEPSKRAAALRRTLPDFLAEVMDRDGFFQRRAGKCFAERVGRRFGESEMHLVRGGTSHKVQQWQIGGLDSLKGG
jgi:hypothetical protein